MSSASNTPPELARLVRLIVWGETLCSLCRHRLAACELDSEPLCLDCADLVVERWVLTSERPELVTRLPSLVELVRG